MGNSINHIEAEKNELVLKNSHGDIAIIPATHRREVMDMIKEKCYNCLDAYIGTLPDMKSYAKDGTIIPEGQSIDKELIGTYGNIKAYKVDGEQVRDKNKSDEEFGLSSIHAYLPDLIPEDEIWIEKDVKGDEVNILIRSALYQIKEIEDGVSTDDAYDMGLEYEKNLRDKSKSSGDKPTLTNKKGDSNVYIKQYCMLQNGVLVELVDGEKVRDKYKTDYMEGGHGYVYKWIPNNEIWIENGLDEDEIPYIVLHEYTERTLMKIKKIDYDKAHEISSKVEWEKREEGFTKDYLVKLSEDNILKLVDNINT
jgi:hypothetical protein